MKKLSFKAPKFSKNQLLLFALAFACIGGLIIYRSFAANPNLPGDVNNDNVVNVTDMSILLSNYNTNYPAADFNSDGTVNVLDMSTLLSNYGRSYSAPIPDNAFRGTYYDDSDFTNQKLVRTDNTINFDWADGSPDPSIGTDTFSVVWEGNFTFEAANYDFTATVDDGVRLYIDGQLLIDKWFVQSATPYTATKSMTAGKHQIKMQYYEADGAAVAKLVWNKQSINPPPPTGSLHLAWDTYEQVPAKYGALDRMQTTTLSSMPPGVSKVISVNVNNSDNTSATGDGTYALNRSDGQGEPWIQEGAETWESFWYLIPDGTDSRYPGTWRHSVISSGWNTFYEYHEPGIAQRSTHLGAWGSDPPVWQLIIAGGNPSSPSDVWVRGPVIEPNKWHFMLFHWKWSRQNAGYVEAWINGQQWISRTTPNLLYGNANFPGAQSYPVANNFPTAWNVNGTTKGGYFEIGHYRGPSRSDTDTTYMAKIRVGTTRSVVEGN